MLRIDNLPQECKDFARQKAEELPTLNNSITKGEGNYVGFIGEWVAKKFLGGVSSNTYDYDLVLGNGETVDVKTKKTSFEPQPHYECSVAAYNTKQKCDYYAFVRVDEKNNRAWYLGVYKKEDYYKDARKLKKGDLDPSNNFVCKADCFNLPISKLEFSPDDL